MSNGRRRDGLYRIGEVAARTGASIDTIRYYEKLGLIDKPSRSEGGFRRYPAVTIEKLRFIRNAQHLGFTLHEIKRVIGSSREGLKPCCDYVKDLIGKKLNMFEIKIKELQRMRKNLKKLLRQWIPLEKASRRSYVVCPQIESGSASKSGGKRNGKKKS